MNAECVLREDRFYIVSPIDILLAQKRDVADHIDWLLQKKDFEVHNVQYTCIYIHVYNHVLPAYM